jgi:hypothetical protein
MSDWTVKIGNLELDAQDLSGMTYGSVPSTQNSPGAVWLRAVATAYLDDRDELLAENYDTRDEIVNRVSGQVSSTETWQVVTDLRLFADAQDGLLDYGLWAEALSAENPRTFRQETVWAVRKDKLTDALQGWLDETARALLYALWQADIAEHGDPADNDDPEDPYDPTTDDGTVAHNGLDLPSYGD